MRLMLGTNGQPELLVSVGNFLDRNMFDFHVINGGWGGKYINGRITVNHPCEPFSTMERFEILCDNQDRLRCNYRDYQDVFNNFHNVDYKGPEVKHIVNRWDDEY